MGEKLGQHCWATTQIDRLFGISQPLLGESERGGQKNSPFDAGWIKNVLPEERLRTVQSREEQMNSSGNTDE